MYAEGGNGPRDFVERSIRLSFTKKILVRHYSWSGITRLGVEKRGFRDSPIVHEIISK